MIEKDDRNLQADEKVTSSQPVTGTDGSETDLVSKIAAAISGKRSEAAEPEEESEQPDDASSEDASGADDDATEWSLEDDDVRKAWETLRRDDWKPEHIRALNKRELLARGRKRAQVQADIDRAFGQLKSGKKEASSDETADKPYQGLPDLEGMAKTLTDTLALDEAESKTFTKSLVEMLNAAISPFANAVVKMAEQSEARGVDGVRGELVERIPELADDEVFQKVRERARKFAQADGVALDSAHIKAAALAEGLEIVPTSEIERKKKLTKYRKGGTPSAPSGQPKKVALTGSARIAEGIRLMGQGLTREEILARLG